MSLKEAAISGVKWTTISSILITVFNFLQLAVLARLLSPADFGLMAMITVVIGFAANYADMGVSSAIIYRQDATKEQLSSLYWLSLLVGASVFLLFLATIPAIVAFYSEPQLAGLIPWLALSFIINPLGTQFRLLMQKNFRFHGLALIEISAALLGLTVAIITALLEQSVFALIWGNLSSDVVKNLLFLNIGLKEWRPKWHFRYIDLKGYLSFGFYQMGERSANYLNTVVDQLIIGSLIGAQALGYYKLAWGLAIQPVLRINPILTRVAFPLFARLQNEPEQLRKGFLLVIRTLSTVNAPLLLGLAAVAPVLIPVVFGEKWIPAVPLVQVLALVTLIRSLINPVGSLLLARGRADLGFKWNCILLITQLPSIYLVGAYFGDALSVAISLVILQLIYFLFNYIILIRTLIGSCLREYMLSIISPLGLASIMGSGVLAASTLITQFSVLTLFLLIMAGLLIFIFLVILFQRQQIIFLKALLKK